MKIFTPNLTSKLLIESASAVVNPSTRLLDLGSGGGVVGMEVAKAGGLTKLYSSDVDSGTRAVVNETALKYGIDVDHRIGSLFGPWANERFDVIIDDVSGVSAPIAAVSPWFDQVPCDSGESGVDLVCGVLREAHKYLRPAGKIVFPVISLSDRTALLRTANMCFGDVALAARRDWPLPQSMQPHLMLMRELKEKGYCEFRELSGLIICSTEIYVATDCK